MKAEVKPEMINFSHRLYNYHHQVCIKKPLMFDTVSNQGFLEPV